MQWFSTISTKILNWWHGFNMNPTDEYLNQAVDLVDLEHRLRAISYRETNKTRHGVL